MSHAAASGELALTERTKNLRATVDFRVQVLFMKFIRNQCCSRKWETHHFEVVLILELHATIWAVTLVMLLCLHMLLSTGDRMKLPTTGFTRYLGCPMTPRVHVLSCLSLTMKHLLAWFATKSRLPVAGVRSCAGLLKPQSGTIYRKSRIQSVRPSDLCRSFVDREICLFETPEGRSRIQANGHSRPCDTHNHLDTRK